MLYKLINFLMMLLIIFPMAGRTQGTGWSYYGQDAGGQRYTPVRQINDQNVGRLTVAWTYRTGELDTYAGTYALDKAAFESTPILIGRTLYVSTPSDRVIA